MTTKELENKQNILRKEIYARAEVLNLSNDHLEPILDGVGNIEKYLNAKYKIMWILKEPYDYEDEKGNPVGGGFILFDKNEEPNETAKKMKTLQVIAYTTYGILNNTHKENIEDIHANKDIFNTLECIAYINISKMPNHPNSNNTNLWKCYEQWEDILLKQIDLYKPDIIIFGGTPTMNPFREDLSAKGMVQEYYNDAISVYNYNGTKIIEAYHPNQRKITWNFYIDSIVDACNK